MPTLPIVAMLAKLALLAKLAISATLVNMLTQAFFCLLIHGYARVLDMEFKTNKHHCV